MADNTANNPVIEAKIMSWLRQACDRDGGGSRRFQAKWRCVCAGMSDIKTDNSDTDADSLASDEGEDNENDCNQ